MAAKCELVGLYNSDNVSEIPKPGPGESFVVYRTADFTESGIHGFIRIIPAVGLSMARSSVSIDKAERIGKLAAEVVATLDDGKISDIEAMMLFSAIKQLSK